MIYVRNVLQKYNGSTLTFPVITNLRSTDEIYNSGETGSFLRGEKIRNDCDRIIQRINWKTA